MRQGKPLRRLLAMAMTGAMLLGMTMTAGAWEYPKAYWKYHNAWDAAFAAQDVDGVIQATEDVWNFLYAQGLNLDICGNLEYKCGRASWLCETKGDLDGALKWLNRQEEMARWLTGHGKNYSDTILVTQARRLYLENAQDVTIYAQPDQLQTGGTLAGSTVDGSRTNESAVLAYVQFADGYSMEHWVNYYKNTSPKFHRAVTSGGVIELAWNVQEESDAGCHSILDPANEDYMNSALKTLGGLDATVLLRVGAEMNVWSGGCTPELFQQAFRKVADAARAYPNIQMVFSPNCVGRWGESFERYYPGDGYVDWIGLSLYHNSNYTSRTDTFPSYSFDNQGYGVDAFYGEGLYDSDPLVMMEPFVRFAEKHGKPMMISEGGASGYDRKTGRDQTGYAVDQVNKLYSWVNMRYPQVKALFYFDAGLSSSRYDYHLAENTAIANAYETAIDQNGGYLREGDAQSKPWFALDQLGAVDGDTLRLAAYASFPGQYQTTVQYYVDGQRAGSSSAAPYYFDLDLTGLAGGTHTVKVVARSGPFEETATAQFTVKGEGRLPLNEADPWARELLKEAQTAGLITDRTCAGFRNKITRLQFAELAVNLIEKLTGTSIDPTGQGFDDTKDVMAQKAAAAGVASGDGTGRFRPNAPIDRQQICVMLNNALKYIQRTGGTNPLTDTSTVLSDQFQDAGQVADWAREAVALLTNGGVMSGTGNGVAPTTGTTVQEAIVLMVKLHGLMEGT